MDNLNTFSNRDLTVGKTYDVIGEDDNLQLYSIIDDELMINQYSVTRFIPVSDMRDEKLNKLGI